MQKSESLYQLLLKRKTIIFIILGVFAILIGIIIKFFLLASNTQKEYFPYEHSIIFQNQLDRAHPAKMIDGKVFVPLDFVKESIDSTVTYDQSTQSVIVTMPRSVYQLPSEKLNYFMNEKKYKLDFPAIKGGGQTTWVAAEWIASVYPVKVTYQSSTGAVFLYKNGYKKQQAAVKADAKDKWTKLREKSSRTSPYYTKLQPSDKLFLMGKVGAYYKVRTAEGYGGYLPEQVVLKQNTKTVETKTKITKAPEVNQPSLPFQVVWDGIYVAEANPKMVDQLAGVEVMSPTWFKLKNKEGAIKNIASKSYVEQAHKNGDKVWALFSNDFDPDMTAQVLPSFEKRQSMIRQLIKFADIYEIDGINIDFENVYEKNGDDFTQFVRELVSYAHSAGLTVTVNVTFESGSGQWSKFFDRKELAKTADFLMVMAYDEHWANAPQAGSVASLPWVENHLKSTLQKVPADKLLLGVPMYTRLWKEEKQENGETKVSSESKTMKEAKQWMNKHHLKPKVDQSSGQHYVELKKENKVYRMWLEDGFSLKKRISLVGKYNLAGVSAWSRHFAEPSIWKEIEKDLNRK
ncbi:glycosyl hydrolase family 18 protein [Halobacillus salinarum]|uniref:Glycosyl hydrolase family 18 protein n=1 Tax=Halobacillus salinarum TaxID=2932257 RepID=A0ABY4EFL3_9BACI|nr:glycosyl hydrolase family 18 protein [Halobacillus salinarum]UOQ42946.1 glycosyl hydrolase family 18 protein [Halobacillus salinarum]